MFEIFINSYKGFTQFILIFGSIILILSCTLKYILPFLVYIGSEDGGLIEKIKSFMSNSKEIIKDFWSSSFEDADSVDFRKVKHILIVLFGSCLIIVFLFSTFMFLKDTFIYLIQTNPDQCIP